MVDGGFYYFKIFNVFYHKISALHFVSYIQLSPVKNRNQREGLKGKKRYYDATITSNSSLMLLFNSVAHN